jgi:hypothetical protein
MGSKINQSPGVRMDKILLSVGTNHTLLNIRNMTFVQAGYRVVAARTAATALTIINSQPLDAVIIGHSLSLRLKQTILEAAKTRGLATVVLHANAYEGQLPGADANLCGIDGAARILDILKELERKQQPKRTVPRAEYLPSLEPAINRAGDLLKT